MTVRIAMLMLAMAAWLAAADIDGKWKATFEGQDGPIEVLYEFKVEGGKVTGSLSSVQGGADILDGRVEGDSISFDVERDTRRFPHKGKIAGDEIKLEVVIGERTVSVTAKRVTT